MQYFFAFSFVNNQEGEDIDIPCDIDDVIKNETAVVLPNSVKYELFPIARNTLFVRLENIGDRFDTDRWAFPSTTISFPLDQFSRNLFAQSNLDPKTNLTSVLYQELSLTGNQLYSDVLASKTAWSLNTTAP